LTPAPTRPALNGSAPSADAAEIAVSERFDPTLMALRGRIGGLVRSARHDGRESTEAARTAFLNKLEREADPEGALAPEERRRRAEALRRAHLARASLAAVLARRAKSRKARPFDAGQK
jgi:hypothetical protein